MQREEEGGRRIGCVWVGSSGFMLIHTIRWVLFFGFWESAGVE